MIRKILSLGTNRLVCNENLPTDQSNVRAFATQAALATSVDASPAVLINLWDHGHRSAAHYERGSRRRAS